MAPILVKNIWRDEDIDNLRVGEVVEIEKFATFARFGGIRDKMLVFSYRAGKDRIYELWVNREDVGPKKERWKGTIAVNPSGRPYEPIEYDSKNNIGLYQQKNRELSSSGVVR